MTDCQEQELTPEQHVETLTATSLGLLEVGRILRAENTEQRARIQQMEDDLERVTEFEQQASRRLAAAQLQIIQLQAEAEAAAAQSARQCRELLHAEGEIAMAYERGYEDAVRKMLAEVDE